MEEGYDENAPITGRVCANCKNAEDIRPDREHWTEQITNTCKVCEYSDATYKWVYYSYSSRDYCSNYKPME